MVLLTCVHISVPAPVTALLVENLGTTCCLKVSWQEAVGVANGYILQILEDRGGHVTNASLSTGHRSYQFQNLTAGRRYRVLVQTTSWGVVNTGVGADARTSKICCLNSFVLNESKQNTMYKCEQLNRQLPPSGPAAVSDLSIRSNSSSSLSFLWSPAEGDLDSYEVVLYRSDESLQERRHLQANALQCTFQRLTPGATYKIVVLTHSGQQNNQTSMWARTGKLSY